MTVSLFVGTPTLNGTVMADYTASLFAAAAELRDRGITMTYRIADGPNAATQRDMLAADCLKSDCSHLLLVDGDMAFPPNLPEKLLSAARAVVGAIYPARPPDLRRFHAGLRQLSFEEALAGACEWTVTPLGPTFSVRDGFCQVAAIGTGFLLVERTCLSEMSTSRELPTYVAGGRTLPTLFRETLNDGAVAHPDRAFCRRWRDRGGDVWAFVSAPIRRVTDFEFGLPFTSYLRALGRPPAEPGTMPVDAAAGTAPR